MVKSAKKNKVAPVIAKKRGKSTSVTEIIWDLFAGVLMKSFTGLQRKDLNITSKESPSFVL
jgi:hypothetical protein